MEQTKNRAIPPAATRLSALLVAVLLFLRLPFLVAAGFGAIDQDIGLVVFLCGTYLCTGLFFCLNRGELGRYYITPATLALFLLSPLAALLADGEDITGWLRLVMAACFAGWLLWKKGVCTGRLPARKHLANLAITLPLCVLLPVLCWTILGKPAVEGPAQTLTMGMVLGALGFQFSFAAVSEEPLFRGILHGLLKKRGWRPVYVCLLVAALFWLGHLYYIGPGPNFWLIHPLLALTLSLIAELTQSLACTMAVHSCVNAFSDLLRLVRF